MPSRPKRNAIPRSRNTHQSDLYTPLPGSSPPAASSYDSEPPAHWSSPPPENDFYPEPAPEGIGGTASRRDAGAIDALFSRVSGEDDPPDDPDVRAQVPVFPGQALSPDSRTSELLPRNDALSQNAGFTDHQVGHTRSPMLAREPTTLESFSRTIRNYIPTSIPIPSASPTPPRISRPLSFGSFLTPSMSPVPAQRERSASNTSSTWKRQGSDAAGSPRPDLSSWAGQRVLGDDAAVFDLDEELSQATPTRYPAVNEKEEIVWAGWDQLVESDSIAPRRLLLMGYKAGLQIWDCTNLGSVAEVLNLTDARWGTVEFAGVLPLPRNVRDDAFRDQRPLVGILSRNGGQCAFVVYSLRTHTVVKRIDLPGLRSFSSSADFVVLGTAKPPSLHILSSYTLTNLYTIPSTSLVAFAAPSVTPTSPRLDLDKHYEPSLNTTTAFSTSTSIPQPIYALHGRLLAFASPVPRLHSPPPSSGPKGTVHPSSWSADGTSRLNITQADLGTAAVKLGGNVLSGMRSLGGMAISAARAGIATAAAAAAAESSIPRPTPAPAGLSTMFSRSAPAAAGADDVRPSQESAPNRGGLPAFSPLHRLSSSSGCNVTVVDLQPLLASAESPSRIADFLASKRQCVSNLRFSGDGTSLAVCAQDGHSAKIYRLGPPARTSRSAPRSSHDTYKTTKGTDDFQPSDRSRTTSHTDGEESFAPPWHLYNLRRGRTSAVVDGLDWANDGRWFAMGTRKRTVHVFAVNPTGGVPDEASHLSARVFDPHTPLALSTEVHPVIRLRGDKAPLPEIQAPPLAFTFIRSSENSLPSNLLPPMAPTFSASSSPSSIHSLAPSSPARQPRRPSNFQDMLIFDALDATLSLRRVFVERANEESASGLLPGATSMSLPGPSSLARLGMSSSSNAAKSGLSQMMEEPTHLAARESRVGSWNLRRAADWREIRQVVFQKRSAYRRDRPQRADWLSCAELSTHSSSSQTLPRSIYLSHQFAFHALGEDYHALVRRHNFEVPSTRIAVRAEVEVNAFPSGFDATFMLDSRAGRRASSSFDEPLASALAGDIVQLSPSLPVLPMFPNGAPGASSRSLKNAIPIRHVAAGLSDSMSGSLTRLRREMGRVRSPQLAARPDADLPVPLEFDEEDDDFIGANGPIPSSVPEDEGMSYTHSRGGGDSGESISTPSSNMDPLPVEDDHTVGGLWQGWEAEDQLAVEEAERFDDLTAGFVDEDPPPPPAVEGKKRKKQGKIVRRT